ncbi:adhesion G protein-coupled receptor E1-like, partial [Exaiptasia diaphana]|uniref:Uncharacterized protein n=1 Tax=Exaiptasia diaphana TaxID=2652724 RepID=A0A913Y7S2_EXADI
MGDKCEIDLDECNTGHHMCHPNAACTNNVGSYTCACQTGYQGNGRSSCTDIDECLTKKCAADERCYSNIQSITSTSCFNTVKCSSGYRWGSTSCIDMDECNYGTYSCPVNTHCVNTAGSYTCKCNTGYHGGSSSCSDINECTNGVHKCPNNARCTNTVGSYTCQCRTGSHGIVTVQTNCQYSSFDRFCGRITSPGFPGLYTNMLSCYWKLYSTTAVSIAIESFNTEANYDYLRIYDGPSVSSKKIGEFHGLNQMGTNTSSSRYLYVTFTTDGSALKTGFSFIYK